MTNIPEQHEIGQNYCFRWNDYQNHLSDVVQQLLEEDCMVDVTIYAAGYRVHAHRIVLCACSTLLQEIFSQVTDDHPTIILSDVSPQDLKSIIEFAYHGEIRIPVENISSLLDAARSLKISGLIEIEGLDENEDAANAENSGVDEHITEMEENAVASLEKDLQDQQEKATAKNNTSKKKGRRREFFRKEYSDIMLTSAIDDLKSGQTLVEAATKNKVPRSTLYMRAKSLGIHLSGRNEYPAENMKAAITAVKNGSSLQHASDLYKIPKTVLWRRMQKEGHPVLRAETRRSYGLDKREAAVKALERGENLSKVASKFKIPKTTLFRDKTRLVDQGKLPLSFWKKRKIENEELKKSRLEEAVAACKGGRMSQAVASMTYHIPKTTIWRKLQQDGKKTEKVSKVKNERLNTSQQDSEIKTEENSNYSYCEVSSEIPIAYIDEENIPEDSVIILTTEEIDELNLEEGRQIIVNPETGQGYIPCSISVDGSANYSQAES
ncbi:uncharacterized protein LOC116852641 [Odontomachus brunneus]|uniref:uncharacterized protein LOC116852641 n=1 Tax=Odontomachus brunneus TaxID=486640 RepID=UPI0013F2646C|nr:uncharacterized protein LOC116852641 [Odontomachus brunneus]